MEATGARWAEKIWTYLKRYGLLFFLFCAAVSCGQDEDTGGIEEDKLIAVLIDVHIAEAAVQALRGETKDSVINVYYDQICTIHGVGRDEFETTMEKYRNEPKRMEALYGRVLEEMERQEVEEEKEEE